MDERLDDLFFELRNVSALSTFKNDRPGRFKRFVTYAKPADNILRLTAGGEAVCSLPFDMSVPSCEAALLLYCISGSLTVDAGSLNSELDTGHFCFLSLSEGASLKIRSSVAAFRYFFVEGDLSAYLTPASDPLPVRPYDTSSNSLTLEQLFLVPENLGKKEMLYAHLLITRVLTDYYLCRPHDNMPDDLRPSVTAPIPAYISSMHDSIVLNYSKPLSLQFFEDLFKVDKFKLCREYRLFFGVPPMRDLNNARVKNAKKMLLSSSFTVQEISSRVGFYDINNFTRIFKKITGYTPAQYRNLCSQ